MTTRSLRGRAFVRGSIHEDVLIVIDDGTFVDVNTTPGLFMNAEPIRDGIMAPGFIDLHVHGGDGADFMDASASAIQKITAYHARNGTTSLAATTLSAPRERITETVEVIAREAATGLPGGAEIAGIHLEGPYINKSRAGAQSRDFIRAAEIHELEGWIAAAPALSWIVTVAPECEGVRQLIERFRDRIVFSIGHTAATLGEALEAVEIGARHFTHLCNAMPPLHHRDPGPIAAALVSTETTAELIADGIHVHPVVLHFLATALAGRATLVTDAMRACGLPDGSYRLLDHEVTVRDGAARLTNGTLAGSVLTMIGAVRNMVELAGLPIENVLPLATEVPARVLGLGARKGRIETGFDADLVVISPRLEIERTLVRGREVYHS